jgi:hypothetical protein
MGKSTNIFLKSKMNQDLDSRLIPSGEYRSAKNIQVSASESENVGSVENILGNISVLDIAELTGVEDLFCIGHCVNNETSDVYLFWTNWVDTPNNRYSPGASNFIVRYNSQTETSKVLVQGSFLNFSRQNPIYGSNVLETLLFWTDNRNQPRVLNLKQAEANINYYTTEDQISVAKYSPYSCIELFEESYLSSTDGTYESTLKDVVSKSYPNGGFGNLNSDISANTTTVDVNSFVGDIVLPGAEYPTAATVGYTAFDTGQITIIPGATLSSATYNSNTAIWTFTIVGGVFPELTTLSDIVLNPNPYYNSGFAGDPDFLESKFSRFSYRFKYEDNEYSIFAPFTQAAFIPEQDGYFLYVKKPNISEVQDQSDTYRSTTVSFMKNKVNDIELRIPLPFKNYDIQNSLKLKEIDILYKESDATAVKVIETITIGNIINSAGTFSVNGAVTNSVGPFSIDNIKGGITVGSLITGFGIVGKPKVTVFEPTNPNNPSSGGQITLDLPQTLVDNVVLNVNNPDYFVYNYQSKKPFKTLPEADLIRVYDKIPVKALAQEVSGNRVIYANFQNKHTPPKFLNYNVTSSAKAAFDLKEEKGEITGGPYNGTTITIDKGVASPPNVGDFITLVVGTGNIPENTQVVSVTETGVGTGVFIVVLTNAVTNLVAANIVLFQPGSDTSKTTSIIEYPNHSVKSNRNYQVGVVLSDRYGRTSTVVLSNNKDTILVGSPPRAFSGSTIYSPYIDRSVIPSQWPGNSLKILFNQVVSSTFNAITGTPGLYSGDYTSVNYNPLGWYSYKIVVKQTEQEYYNVYLPGIMAAYPSDTTLELGSTSHVVLINDNINKVPRDLSEVGPEQRQFRSSVKLFGRVENTDNLIDPTNDLGSSNRQYYPERFNDIVSTISTNRDLFDYTSIGDDAPRPDYFPQFYDLESNPLIARVSTHRQIGQISTTNYETVSAQSSLSTNTDIIRLASIAGDPTTINPGDKVLGSGFPDDLVIETPGFTAESPISNVPAFASAAVSIDNKIILNTLGDPAQSIAVGDLVYNPANPNSIPAGTFITAIDVGNIEITLNNAVNVSNGTTLVISNPARIKVNKPVSITADQTVTIVNDATPGLQYLAVYETEPVESLLDIFWETSTSGLISDLNNAIIDAESGGASLSGLNPSPFTEGLEEGGEIFLSPFSMLDNFGQIIPFTEIDETLEITSITNGLNENVDNYFTLIQVASSNLFNIETTTEYFDTMFFNYSELSRIFTFKFRTVINGLETFFEEEVALQNVAPNILQPTQGQTFSITPSTAGVTNISARNGSANTQDPPTGSPLPLSGNFNAGDCTIISQTQGSVDGPEVNYFAISEVNVSGTATNASWLLSNTAVGTIPTDTFYLTIRVQDAGGSSFADEVDIIITTGVTVENIYQRIIATTDITLPRNSPCWGPGPLSNIAYQFITFFEVTSGPLESQGWYIYNGAFSHSSFNYFVTSLGGVADSPIGYNNTSWSPFGLPGSLINNLDTEGDNVLKINFAEANGDITQLKYAPTQEAAFNEWFNGGVGGSQPCRYSQVWPFDSGYPYNPSTDGYGAECQPLNPLPGNIGRCVPGMTSRDNVPYAVEQPGSGVIGSAPGGVLDISANSEQFNLNQYTWAVVT